MAEIRMMSTDNLPSGWALCNGQLLPINQNQGLFSLLGITYGGNGQTNFALPDLRGRVPIHTGSSHNQGEAVGSEAVTINIQQLPTHNHFLAGVAADGNDISPNNRFYAKSTNGLYDQPVGNLVAMSPAVTSVGGSQPHENRQPFLVVNFMIALQGVFPSQA